MQFDVRAAKALKADEHLIIPGAPGLRLQASGAGRAFIYRYKSPVDGRMRQIKIGDWPSMSAAQAGGEWERLRDERAAGRDPAVEKRVARRSDAVAERDDGQPFRAVGALVDGFVEWAAAARRAKGAAELRRIAATMLPATLRALAPAAVTRSVAYDLISSYAEAPVQAVSLRRELGAAWEWAHDSGRLSDAVPNWWRQILRGKLKSKGRKIAGKNIGTTKRVLTLDEVAALIRFLPNHSRLNADLLTLYLWTGCRGGELVQMEGAELSEDAQGVLWWLLPKSKIKMERHELAADLWIPMLGRAREIALRRREQNGAGHLFPVMRGKAPHVDQKVVGVATWTHHAKCESHPEWVRQRLDIAHWSPHDLRRTVRTHLARLGCPRDIAEAVLGHIDPDEDVYNRHDYRAERLEWLTTLTSAWEEAARR